MYLLFSQKGKRSCKFIFFSANHFKVLGLENYHHNSTARPGECMERSVKQTHSSVSASLRAIKRFHKAAYK